MDEAKLTQLASLLGVEPTVEALKSALEQVMMVLDGGENAAEPTEEQAQYQEAMRSAFGVDSNEAVLSTLKNIKSLLDATAGDGEGEQDSERELAVDLAGLAEFGNDVNKAAKNAKNVPLRIPYQSTNGKKSQRYGSIAINKGAERPGLMTLISGMLEGNSKKIASASKASGVSQNITGGYLAREEISGEIIEPLYSTEVVMAAGADVVPMNGIETLTLRKELSGATAYWGGEHEAVGQSEVNIGRVVLSLKELVAEYRISNRLLRNSDANVEMMIRRDITNKMRLRMDKSFLFGTGGMPSGTGHSGAEPTGLLNLLPAAQKTSLGTNGAKPKLTDLTAARVRIMNRNVEQSDTWGWAMHPSVNEYFNDLTDTAGNPLLRPDWNSVERQQLQGHSRYTTTQIDNDVTVGTSTDTSYIFVGDWQYAVVGMGMDIEFAVDESVYRRERDTLIQAVLMVDFGVYYTEAFEVLTGVRS